jgi:hypothetical protein
MVFIGARTPDQKMAQDLFVSTWPAVERVWRNSPRFRAKDSWSLRQYAKFRRYFGTIVRLVAKRASKTNSWDLATGAPARSRGASGRASYRPGGRRTG